MGLLPTASVSLKLKKCFFYEDLIDYLGHVVLPCRLVISMRATDAIGGLQHPTNETELKSLFWLCNVIIMFVPNLARIAKL